MSDQDDMELNEEVDERLSSHFKEFVPQILESQDDQDEMNDIKKDMMKKVNAVSPVCII
jgi:hypothetical protein